MVTIELYGVPRLRAGVGRVDVEASSVAEALGRLAEVAPSLAGMIEEGPSLHPAYRLCINGDRFVDDPRTPLNKGDNLLVFSSDVGG